MHFNVIYFPAHHADLDIPNVWSVPCWGLTRNYKKSICLLILERVNGYDLKQQISME